MDNVISLQNVQVVFVCPKCGHKHMLNGIIWDQAKEMVTETRMVKCPKCNNDLHIR